MSVRILQGDCRAVLATLDAASIDACVTDPPYGLEFMGRDWDAPWKTGVGLGGMSESGFGAINMPDGFKRLPRPNYVGGTNPTCRNCGGLQRGKPGKKGQQPCRCDAPRFDNVTLPRMRAFQAWTETWSAEVYRVLKPGSHLVAFGGTRTYHRLTCAIEDAGFEIRDCLMWLYGSGFPKGKGCLKPGWEPIILARKPGPSPWLNVDGCRVEYESGGNLASNPSLRDRIAGGNGGRIIAHEEQRRFSEPHAAGRWPANVVLDDEAAEILDDQAGTRKSGAYTGARRSPKFQNAYGAFPGTEAAADMHEGSVGPASRFFYCAKASTAERGTFNDHPTVKPLALMQWLIRLVVPAGGVVVDPFLGSGSTALACDREGFDCLGIESDPHAVEIARRRLENEAPLFADVEVSA